VGALELACCAVAHRVSKKRVVAFFDMLNAYGFHSLPASDAAWSDPRYQTALLKAGNGRGGVRRRLEGGALHTSPGGRALQNAMAPLLPAGYELVAVAGSGTEAVRELFTIASAHVNNADAKLLFLEGGYVGGSGMLQGACTVEFIRSRAFAPTDVTDDYIIPAEGAYTFQYESELDGEHEESADDNGSGGGGGALTIGEIACLDALKERYADLCGRKGVPVAGLVVEYVRACDGKGLRATFVAALASFLAQNRLLLLEDAVMTGLRTGAAFCGAAPYYRRRCPAGPDFVAFGKAFGFSGIVAHAAAFVANPDNSEWTFHNSEWTFRQPLANLNGMLTQRMSPADLLRAVTVCKAVSGRGLMRNACRSGLLLKRHLRSQGLETHGMGLLLHFEETRGCLANVLCRYGRLLPCLTFGHEQPADVKHVVVLLGPQASAVANLTLYYAIEKFSSLHATEINLF
jgi:4-aminobutyrate aminotransferase-like enzyme